MVTLTLEIHREDGKFFVNGDGLDPVYGFGDTLTEAVKAFMQDAENYYNELCSNLGTLSPRTMKELDYLSSLFEMEPEVKNVSG